MKGIVLWGIVGLILLVILGGAFFLIYSMIKNQDAVTQAEIQSLKSSAPTTSGGLASVINGVGAIFGF